MNKADTVSQIAEKLGITKKQAGEAYDLLFELFTKSLKKGNRVQVPKFGSFSVSKRKARTGRNPATGEKIRIKASKSVRFSAGQDLKQALNPRRKTK